MNLFLRTVLFIGVTYILFVLLLCLNQAYWHLHDTRIRVRELEYSVTELRANVSESADRIECLENGIYSLEVEIQ